MSDDLRSFVQGLPKAELHLHLEGTLEPELMFQLAGRNGIALPYANVASARAAYDFTDLQSFLDLYYAGCSVLVTEQDFYDLTWAYLLRAAEENIRHVEPFFDPQTHTERGIHFGTVVAGIVRALDDGQKHFGISYRLIMSFLRDMSPASAGQTLEHAKRYGRHIAGVGLDSAELGHPPEDFEEVFAAARGAGYHIVAHAGEEGPPSYITGALDILGAERIDHGVRCLEDELLTARLAMDRVPLTVCPLSNVRLRVVPDMAHHPLKTMMDSGLLVTVNSDDPAYFGGYLVENYVAAAEALGLTRGDIVALAIASFEASFLEEGPRQERIGEVQRHAAAYGFEGTASTL
ncbi:MAG: adenosine deaminase [Coriobacteriia bacterium]|nr:adenosine deaminase [Coriobacteriia bacterium]MBN2847038.1 adenosine deaminase [Coriobacteriia bacterium]